MGGKEYIWMLNVFVKKNVLHCDHSIQMRNTVLNGHNPTHNTQRKGICWLRTLCEDTIMFMEAFDEIYK